MVVVSSQIVQVVAGFASQAPVCGGWRVRVRLTGLGALQNSWLGEGLEVGGSVPFENEDGLSLDNTWSEGSAQSEYQPYEEDFEDDFTVHPPIRRNSESNINEVQSFPRNFPRNFSPPVTRSRGLKLSKKKNKLRFG